MKITLWAIFHATILVVIPLLGLADVFTNGRFDLVERWGKFCGVEGHDPEMF